MRKHTEDMFRLWYQEACGPDSDKTARRIFGQYSEIPLGSSNDILVLAGVLLLSRRMKRASTTQRELTAFLVSGIEASGHSDALPGDILRNVTQAIDRCQKSGFLQKIEANAFTLTDLGRIRARTAFLNLLSPSEFHDFTNAVLKANTTSECVSSSSSIRAEKACEEWIGKKAASGWKPTNKDQAFKEARAVCGDALSRRSFEHAWASAAPHEWKKPGRKS